MQRYFSKESEEILNLAHGEKIHFGEHRPTTDRYMPMQDSPLEGMRIPRKTGGQVGHKHRSDGGSLVMDEPETKMKRGGPMALKEIEIMIKKPRARKHCD
jgi:hypothetical protein